MNAAIVSYVYQHLRATNDPNGNPQRLFVVYGFAEWTTYNEPGLSDGRRIDVSTVAVYDEGYRGRPEALRGLPELPCVDISRSDYHQRIRNARDAGILS